MGNVRGRLPGQRRCQPMGSHLAMVQTAGEQTEQDAAKQHPDNQQLANPCGFHAATLHRDPARRDRPDDLSQQLGTHVPGAAANAPAARQSELKAVPESFMYLRLSLLALSLCVPLAASAGDGPRITRLQRCGDLLEPRWQTFCLRVDGLGTDRFELMLDGKPLAAKTINADGDNLRLRLDAQQQRSGPLWLEQGEQASNPVWLSLAGSHVLAAGPDQVAKNTDGLTSYVDLVSLLIEEGHDGLVESRQLAKKYGAQVVGAIAPLNIYQLRLPVSDLIERDALILRLGSEARVDAVIVEESAPERPAAEADRQQDTPGGDTPGEVAPREDEWAANRFLDAVDYYRRELPARRPPLQPATVRVGTIERELDFDAPDFSDFLGACSGQRTCLYGRDAKNPGGHGSTVAGILAAAWDNGGNTGFLRGLDGSGPRFEVIVERNSDAGITANIAASVNLVEDGVRVLNWSWGIHRVGTTDLAGEEVDSLLRSGIAMGGYEELLEEFFLWLRSEHPDVVVVNSAGNGSARAGEDEYRLPSSFITEQLLVVGGHQRSNDANANAKVSDPNYVTRRQSSNLDRRVDITASACARASTPKANERGAIHCGTSYATPMVTGLVAAMLSLNPQLQPDQLRMLLRRSAMTISGDFEGSDGEDLTAPILPSERNFKLDDPDIGQGARLDMQKALQLTVDSLDRVR